jgi:hypothetical protein
LCPHKLWKSGSKEMKIEAACEDTSQGINILYVHALEVFLVK